MDKRINALFDSEQGKKIYSQATLAVCEWSMSEKIRSGVLVGFSGGPDSVMLLCFLLEYRKRNFDFKIAACHINHSIRGDEADFDEAFSKGFCNELGVEFISEKIDVPSLSKGSGLSLEECARNVRYSKFSDIIQSRKDIAAIAVAHNSNDNLETFFLNVFRGAGTRGAAGIPPVRDNVIRPLIFVPKSDIVSALESAGIEYAVDKTNFETEYKRNKIRHNIVPELYGICEDPLAMVSRLSSNLRIDDDYIDIQAENFLRGRATVLAKDIASLHKAVKVRVLKKMAHGKNVEVSAVVIDSICNLLNKEFFSVSLQGGAAFVCERGVCSVLEASDERYDYNFPISDGLNELFGYDSVFMLTENKDDISSLNVYKISIQADLSSAIIVGDLFIRPKQDGDTVFYGGITRKIKTLFADAKIPKSLRKSIPLLCDEKGVVWVPGFGVRDDRPKNKKRLYAALAIGGSEQLKEKRMRSASEYR